MRGLRASLSGAVLALFLGLEAHGAITLTNVTVVNVTPTSFSVLWRTANSTPSIAVFADPAGQTNVAAQLGVEAFPVLTAGARAKSPCARKRRAWA